MASIQLTQSIQKGLDALLGFLPQFIGFLIILVVGYIVAKIARKVVTKALQGLGLDRALHSGQTGEYVEKLSPGASPSALAGAIAYWFIFLGAISIAVTALGIQGLTNFVNSIAAYLPNVVAAMIIFVIAGAVSTAVGALAARTMGDTTTGKALGAAIPAMVMGIAVFMVLRQLQIAPDIVNITYTALIGATALALALAFGLGGRDVAAKMLSDAYDKGQENRDQVKQDLRQGKEQAQQDAETAKDKAQERAGDGQAGRGQPERPGSYRT